MAGTGHSDTLTVHDTSSPSPRRDGWKSEFIPTRAGEISAKVQGHMRRISWGGGGQEVKTGKGGERNKGETGERGPSCLLVRLLLSTLLAVLAVTSSFCLQCYRVTAGSDRPTSSAASDSALNFNPGTGIPKILLFLRNSVFLSFAASPSLQHPRGTSAVRADLSEKLLLRCSR